MTITIVFNTHLNSVGPEEGQMSPVCCYMQYTYKVQQYTFFRFKNLLRVSVVNKHLQEFRVLCTNNQRLQDRFCE